MSQIKIQNRTIDNKKHTDSHLLMEEIKEMNKMHSKHQPGQTQKKS